MQAVEDMCIHKLAPNLYTRLKEECHRHIETTVHKLVDQTPDHVAFLSLVDDTWSEFSHQMVTIRSIFLYLDRTYVIQTPQLVGLWHMGVVLFREQMMKTHEIMVRTTHPLVCVMYITVYMCCSPK